MTQTENVIGAVATLGAASIAAVVAYDEAKVGATPGFSLVAGWTGPGTPDFGQCWRTALSERRRQGVDQLPNVKRGWILCVKTGDGRIARLKAVEVAGFSSIRFDTVVWEAG